MQELDFLQTLRKFLLDRYKPKISSIILFGSLSDNLDQNLQATDIDLVVVLKDECTFANFKQIKGEIYSIQEKYWTKEASFSDLFLNSIRSATGMFVNTFVCYRSDFLERKFSNVFGVNPLIARILAPQSSVWISIQKRYRIIWGEDIIKIWPRELFLTHSDVIRSFLMNILLSLGALVLGIIKSEMCLYSMESIKWSLFTWKNSFKTSLLNLNQIITSYLDYSNLVEKFALQQLITYRKKKKDSKYLLILAPIFVFLIHYKIAKKNLAKKTS